MGIPGGGVTSCRIKTNDIMADSGANACMANNEEVLVGCHNVRPVSIVLAIKDGGPETTHYCTRMGYLPMSREDGGYIGNHSLSTGMQQTALCHQTRSPYKYMGARAGGNTDTQI